MSQFTDPCTSLAPEQLWSASGALSPRIQRLRKHFWSFYNRQESNEVRSYSTGTPWDMVFSAWSWTNVPEVALFLPGERSYLLAGAQKVELLPGFWEEPLVVRQALFFREVISRYLPVQVLEGELVVGFQFNTALSRCLKKDEARQRDKEEALFLKEWHALNDVGVGNCAAVPGHLVPDYPKALRLGWKGIQEEAQAVAADPLSTPEQRAPGPGDCDLRRGGAAVDGALYRRDRGKTGWRERSSPARRAAGDGAHLFKNPLAAA